MTIKSIILILTLFVGSLILLSIWGFYAALRPPKIFSTMDPKSFGVNYEIVKFRTQDNLLLSGWFVPSAKNQTKVPTIILLHGYGADKGDLLSSRLFLHKHFNLLFFDFRYFGQSEGKYSTAGFYEVRDLQAAIQYLKIRGIHEIGVWGLSMGGAVALMSAPTEKEIKALVIESSYARLDMMANQYFQIPLLKYPLAIMLRFWGFLFLGEDLKKIAPVQSAQKINVPILLIYSKKDFFIPSEHGDLLLKAISKNSQKEVWVIETAPHGGLEKGYDQKVEKFFLKYLK